MKVGTQIFYGCIMSISMQLAAMVPSPSVAALDLTKQRWMAYANTAVHITIAKFLKQFGISATVLHNEELHAITQHHLDKSIDQEIDRYKTTVLPEYVVQECANIKNLAYEVADELHLKYKIKVINDDTLDECNLGIMSNVSRGTYLILVNALTYVHSLEELSDALRHEFCHVVYQDILHKDLLKSLALTDCPTEYKEIDSAFCPVARAQEVRADIYATIHSPHYGKDSITFLHKMKHIHGDIGWPKYPNVQDRITVIELVKKDLEAAAQKK